MSTDTTLVLDSVSSSVAAPETGAAAPAPAVTGLARRAKGKGVGRVRSPDEIERAKASAALTRRLNYKPELIRLALDKALEKSGGRGPEMAEELQLAVAEEFGIKPAIAAIRALLQRLRQLGMLELERDGTANVWKAGSGKPVRKAAGRKPAKVAKAAPKRGPGRPRKAEAAPVKSKKFKGGEAADRLIAALSDALEAAEALRTEMDAVAEVKERVESVLRRLK